MADENKEGVNVGGEKQGTFKVDFPKVIIFVALEKERDLIVKPALEKLGLLGRKDIWSVVTGVGKVSAALTTSMLLAQLSAVSKERLRSVVCINVGVCGGNALAAEKQPTAQINRVVNNDFVVGVGEDLSKREWIAITEVVADMRTCYTMDHFCRDLSELPSNTNELCYVDMELYSVAAACATYDISVVGLKSVSDVIGETHQTDKYVDNFDTACASAADLLSRYLSNRTDVVVK